MKPIVVGLFRPCVVRAGKRERTAIWWMRWRSRTERDSKGCLKRLKESTGSRDRGVALRMARRKETELALGAAGIEDFVDKPWSEAVAEFLATHCAGLRPDSLDLYERALRMFGKTAGPATVPRVTTKLVEDFVAGRLKAGLKPATCNKVTRHLRAFTRWAARRHYLRELPQFHGAFVREDQPCPVVVPREDYEKILATLDQPLPLLRQSPAWWRTFVVLAYNLGCRRSELLGICWRDIDWDLRTLKVVCVTSKSRRTRFVPLTDAPCLVLRQWVAIQKPKPAPEDRLLSFAGAMRRLYDDWDCILAAAGLESIRWKDFRSTTASQLLLSGASTVEARDMLGHSNVSVLERFYANVSGGLRRAAERRAAELQKDRPKEQAAG